MKRVSLLLVLGLLIASALFLWDSKALYQFNSKHQNDLNASLLEEDTAYLSTLNLSTIEVNYDADVDQHFEQLLHLLDAKAIEEYQTQNRWQKAQVVINGTLHEAKVKMHGKEPNFHRVGANFSLKVKLADAPQNTRKFKLIVYDRVHVRGERIATLGRHFDLPVPSTELVQVKVNSHQTKLHALERGFRHNYPKHWVNVELAIEKSPVTHVLSNSDQILMELQQALADKPYSAETKVKIYQVYEALNRALDQGDSAIIRRHFDAVYLASFQVARMVAGFENHGFAPENMLVAIDTTTFKLYPLLHRDFECGSFDATNMNRWEPFYYEGVKQFDFKLLAFISADSTVKMATKKYADEMRPSLPNLFQAFDAIDHKYQKLHRGKYLGITPQHFTAHQLRENALKVDAFLKEN